MTLISCPNCGLVFNTDMFRLQHGEINRLDHALYEINTIFVGWVDLEQTQEDYVKYCLICKDSHYMNEVEK